MTALANVGEPQALVGSGRVDHRLEPSCVAVITKLAGLRGARKIVSFCMRGNARQPPP